MKLEDARFCPDCNEVFFNKGKIVRLSDCPSCTNRATVPLASWFFDVTNTKQKMLMEVLKKIRSEKNAT